MVAKVETCDIGSRYLPRGKPVFLGLCQNTISHIFRFISPCNHGIVPIRSVQDELVGVLFRGDNEVGGAGFYHWFNVEVRHTVHAGVGYGPTYRVTASHKLDILALMKSQIRQIPPAAIDFVELIGRIGKNHRGIALRIDGILRVAGCTAIASRINQVFLRGRRAIVAI